jgi:16S rRNA (guanine527-N7)-methyltransferase
VKRLHEICAAVGLNEEAERKLEALLQLLAGDRSAPTSVRTPDEAVDAHVADSLSVLPLLSDHLLLEPIVDIGSGAGFPGLPLAVAFETAAVDLIESTSRKCHFIARAIEELEQQNARVVCERAEDWARVEGAERYGLAVARALAPLPTLVEYASPLLRQGGTLIAWKGARDPAEERASAAAAHVLGMNPESIHPVMPFPGTRHRHLHVLTKTAPTPAGIPRRPGLARKRPFGRERSPAN